MTSIVDDIDHIRNRLRFVFLPKTIKLNRFTGKLFGKFNIEAGIFIVFNNDILITQKDNKEIGEIYSESSDFNISIKERYEKINRPYLTGLWTGDTLIFTCYGQKLDVKEYSDLTTELANELYQWLSQWYLQNPELQSLEIQEMFKIKPDAKYGYLPSGKMYWNIRLRPVICGNRKDWTFFIIYHENHPQRNKYGSTISVYPVKPNADEILELINKTGCSTTTIPNTIKDSDGLIHLSVETIEWTDQLEVFTAAKYLINTMRWISFFELGLIDKSTWLEFSGHGDWKEREDNDFLNQVSF